MISGCGLFSPINKAFLSWYCKQQNTGWWPGNSPIPTTQLFHVDLTPARPEHLLGVLFMDNIIHSCLSDGCKLFNLNKFMRLRYSSSTWPHVLDMCWTGMWPEKKCNSSYLLKTSNTCSKTKLCWCGHCWASHSEVCFIYQSRASSTTVRICQVASILLWQKLHGAVNLHWEFMVLHCIMCCHSNEHFLKSEHNSLIWRAVLQRIILQKMSITSAQAVFCI